MKLTCPHCQEKFNSKDIKQMNKSSIYAEKQCPSCLAWFCQNKKLTLIKITGISLLLLTSVLNILNIYSEYQLVFSTVGFVGIFVALIITFFGKNEKVGQPNT
ncbi:MAG: hypothetical protein ACTJIB_16810 [Pseudoalteromonas prydzensis]|uniref:Zinc finger/thioredoxin putative domain-containing protein n=2 Tax=Bacteria TaxID=2 RepID=A0ABR9FR35_9GAMM|nr:hypothetical protein [Pseudoalteromonas prydzensis]MBE0459269.1 hypothetical protein [Pseudoalteromonas prydzensis]